MPDVLPDALREADAALHAVVARLRFSAHLNPANIAEARAAFAGGAEAPPFAYAPADFADDALAALARIRVPTAHPLGAVLAASRDETVAWIVALRDRTAEAFDALADRSGWPREADAPASLPTPSNVASPRVATEQLITALRAALRARGFEGWVLVRDEVMSARVLVDASKREIRVHPGAVFREADLVSLVSHEIDVHAFRGENGMRQPLRIFADGLPGALMTEEGLAMLAEEHAGTLSPAFEARQLMLSEAIQHARAAGFREVYERLRDRVGTDAAFTMALRVKRGLAEPGAPGAYAKDVVYLAGWRRVRAWLAQGGDLGWLYVGKVGVEHPVGDWLARGWVRTGPVPKLWAGAPGALARALLRAEGPARPVMLRVAR